MFALALTTHRGKHQIFHAPNNWHLIVRLSHYLVYDQTLKIQNITQRLDIIHIMLRHLLYVKK